MLAIIQNLFRATSSESQRLTLLSEARGCQPVKLAVQRSSDPEAQGRLSAKFLAFLNDSMSASTPTVVASVPGTADYAAAMDAVKLTAGSAAAAVGSKAPSAAGSSHSSQVPAKRKAQDDATSNVSNNNVSKSARKASSASAPKPKAKAKAVPVLDLIFKAKGSA